MQRPVETPRFRLAPLLLGALLLALAPACRRAPAEAPAAQDYAQARGAFRTELHTQGPSPQEAAPPETPEGARRVAFKSGALELAAFVSAAPEDGRKAPAILFLHGGFAFGEGDWEMTEPLREAGFVVMMPLLRGENGQPGAFTFFYDEVEDVLAAADALAGQPGVDASRLYVSGHSVGGTLALLAAQTSKRFRAATSLSGSPDQRGFIQGREEMVPFKLNARELEMRSPRMFATSFKCPTRLFYGDEESYFAQESEETARRAKQAALDVEAQAVPGDHFGAVPAGLRKSIEFFRAHGGA